ncbi:helix-turn-helix domain-containing protein [Aquimarina sp. 2201CG14-23]|uniref:helix-turn-helix domain-containing protein n=1 Tax=Aquimarina mycalae TaxID=3040073 RepID=UPI002477E54C|nr:helix-turn-helix domain-containing protein [Aquimarina sp. 2201CG14-23]MDH7447920.1 helix-turn-helix domain-containing protein [Aquimarina sp. 2201CG14-23]
MNFHYTSQLEESIFNLTDFNCASSQKLLQKNNLYKIIWAKDNDVLIVTDGYKIELKHNQVIFCTPLNILEIAMGQRGIMSFVFNREFYCIRDHDKEVSCNGFLFFGSSLPPVVSLDEKEQESFKMLYYFFREEFEIQDHIQGEMLRVLLKRLLIKSTRLIKKNIPQPTIENEKIDIIRSFNILVEKHFREKHLVSHYADLLNKSPKTLSNLFKKYSDKTALTYINERILLEAKRLLLFSDKTSTEIAYELGYKEPAHFSKFFKNQIGSSPIEFKKSSLQNK